MTIEFHCSSCQHLMRTPDGTAGKKGKCPWCGAVIDIPARSPDAQRAADAILPTTPVMPTGGSAGDPPTDGKIEFPCPYCGRPVRTAAAVGGKKGKCPNCAAIVQIPNESPPRIAARPQTIPGKPGRDRFRTSSASEFQSTLGLTPLPSPSVDQRDLLTADWNVLVPERRLPSAPRKPKPALRHLAAKHTSWLVPVAACVVLVVLIAGILGVRKIIIRKVGETVATVKRVLRTGGPEAATSLEGQARDENRASEEQTREKEAPLDSNEPGLEVLPPAAAKLPGRKLPRLLCVGRHPQMFPSLEEAVKVVIPGDTIEIRTNELLAETGAELRWKERPKDTPLVIRAGRGFEPVLRARPGVRLLTVVNADLKAIGLHFAHCGLFAENGNVHLERCTMTKAGLSTRSARGPGEPLQVTVDRCFVRNGSLGVQGPFVQLTIRESALVGKMWTISMTLDEDQSIVIEQTSIVNCYLLQLDMPPKPPATPLSFRMDRSVFGVVSCCPLLLGLAVPEAYAKSGKTGCHEALRQAFRECKARDNFASYWSWWASVGRPGVFECYADWIFPELPQNDQTLRFGKRVEQTRSLIYEKHQNEAGMAVFATVLPEDLPVTSTGPLGKRLQEGVRYGCDPAQLPVPPPLTLQAASQAPTPAPPAPRK